MLSTLEGIQEAFNQAQSDGKRVSLADLIVLGGCAGIEKAAKNAGHNVKVPFTPGRADASQEQTDMDSFAVLEPAADGFRNYLKAEQYGIGRGYAGGQGTTADADSAGNDRSRRWDACSEHQLRSVEPRCIHEAPRGSHERLLRESARPGHDLAGECGLRTDVFEGRDRATGALKWTGTRVDLIFGSNSELRAIAEVYGCEDSQEKFVQDFVAAWTKVMNLDRFDLV